MRKISAKQLRKEIIDNIEKCENIEVIHENLKAKGKTIEDFKKEHQQEGAFTDEDGIMAMTIALYLGITLSIISSSNNKINPFTVYNKGKPYNFYIFYDERAPGHFQSLKHPEIKKAPTNRYSLGDSSDNANDLEEVPNPKPHEIKKIQESISCDKCNKSFHNIKQLTHHHMRFDTLQCVFCHKEISNDHEFRMHEEEHQDTGKNYKCDLCEKKYKSAPEARLHAYCHNHYEILKQIKKFEGNLDKQMMDVPPDIIGQAKNEFILKQKNDREKRIQHEISLKQAAKEAAKKKIKNEEIMNVEEEEIEIKQGVKESLRESKEKEIKAEKEDLEFKRALEESLKKNTEESIKAKKEDLEIKKALEESLRESKEKAKKEQEELKKKKKS